MSDNDKVPAELQVAILNAIDHYVIAQRTTMDSFSIKERVRAMFTPGGREVSEDDLTDDPWPGPSDVAARAFVESLRQGGYAISRAET